MQIETRREAADRLAIAAAVQRGAERQARAAQALAADAILSRKHIEHITMWTDDYGRPKIETRMELTS